MIDYQTTLPNLLLPCILVLTGVQLFHGAQHPHKPCTLVPNTRGFGKVLYELTYTTNEECFRECVSLPQCHGISISPENWCQLIGGDFHASYQRFWAAASRSCFQHSDEAAGQPCDSDHVAGETRDKETRDKGGRNPGGWLAFNDHSYVLTAIKETKLHVYQWVIILVATGLLIFTLSVLLRRKTASRSPTSQDNESSPEREEVIENNTAGKELPSYSEAMSQKEGSLPPSYQDVMENTSI